MSFKDFRFQVIIRTILLAIGCFGINYFAFIEVNYIRLFFLVLFCIIVLTSLFFYINRSNKDTEHFIEAILHNDFSIKYAADGKGKSFKKLYSAFNKINALFNERAISEESEYSNIVALVEQMDVGVVIYDQKQRIHLANKAFKKFIGKEELINLDQLKKIAPNLTEQIEHLNGSESKLYESQADGENRKFTMASSELKVRRKWFKIVTMQDINSTLDHNETMAWQKLIRVLTHEIMNSVSPITSLSSSLKSIVNTEKEGIESTQLNVLKEGLDAIENRSKGLMSFTETYRQLTRVPVPKLEIINGHDFVKRITSIFDPMLNEKEIEFSVQQPEGPYELKIDAPQIEQVVLNLLKNALEALDDNPQSAIELSIEKDSNTLRTMISIKDNGPGIPEDVRDKIFIPFYTTKTTGSGIGLSLSRQIVNMHKGRLSYKTGNDGTEFTITL